MTKEEPPIGYMKVYNPILWMTVLIATTLTMATSMMTVWLFYTDVPDRALTMFLIVISFAEMNITIGLWYLTYRYARISEEPLQKLKHLAQTTEQALAWWDTLTWALAPVFNGLKDLQKRLTVQPPDSGSAQPSQPAPQNNNQSGIFIHPEVAKYFENYTNALRGIDTRLRDMEKKSHVREKDEPEEPSWGTENLK